MRHAPRQLGDRARPQIVPLDEISGAAAAGPSPLHGRGLIAARDAPAGSILACTRSTRFSATRSTASPTRISPATSRRRRRDVLRRRRPRVALVGRPTCGSTRRPMWTRGRLARPPRQRRRGVQRVRREGHLAYYSAPRNVVITRLPDAPPLLCWVATRDPRRRRGRRVVRPRLLRRAAAAGVPWPTAAVREAASA